MISFQGGKILYYEFALKKMKKISAFFDFFNILDYFSTSCTRRNKHFEHHGDVFTSNILDARLKRVMVLKPKFSLLAT